MTGRRNKGRGRNLSREERKLWDSVAQTVAVRLEGHRTPDPKPDASLPEIPFNDANVLADVSALPTGSAKAPALPRSPLAIHRPSAPQVSVTFAPEEAGPVGKPQAGLDRQTADRLRKGARDPDARIDLHGMTADRAHAACVRFLGDAVARGHRVVLVITGKGAGRDRDGFPRRGGGVLRESLPGWLRASPLAPSIVGIYQAHQKHGGSGAFYVYLKKRR